MYTRKKKYSLTTQLEITGLRSGQVNLKENSATFQVRSNKFPFLQWVCIMHKAAGIHQATPSLTTSEYSQTAWILHGREADTSSCF